jgi:hypothetical protein
VNIYKLYTNHEKLKYYNRLSSKLDSAGSLIFRNAKGQTHNDGEKLAVIYADGSQYWYKGGEKAQRWRQTFCDLGKW